LYKNNIQNPFWVFVLSSKTFKIKTYIKSENMLVELEISRLFPYRDLWPFYQFFSSFLCDF
jgi:hypothetical protein